MKIILLILPCIKHFFSHFRFGEMGAIDSLLQQLAYFKRHNPSSPEEQEMMENLFDCLCSLLLHSPNRDR